MKLTRKIACWVPAAVLLLAIVPAIHAYHGTQTEFTHTESHLPPPAPPSVVEMDTEKQEAFFNHHEKMRLRDAAFKAIDHIVKMEIDDREKIRTFELLLKDAKDPAIHNKLSIILASYYIHDITKRKEALELYKGIVTKNDAALKELE